MLDHILIETQSQTHHIAYEVEHTGERLDVFDWRGSLESLEKRVRWEYRKRFNRGMLSIRFSALPKAGPNDTAQAEH